MSLDVDVDELIERTRAAHAQEIERAVVLLRETGIKDDALGELVHDFFAGLATVALNEAGGSEELADSVLSSAERIASAVNNEGIERQIPIIFAGWAEDAQRMIEQAVADCERSPRF